MGAKSFCFLICISLVVLQFRYSSAITLDDTDDIDSKETVDDIDDDDDDGVKLGSGAIVGLIIGILAILVAVPALLCFCLGCCCFRRKQPKIIGVSSSASATLRKQKQPSNDPEIVIEENNRKLSNGENSNRRDSQLSTTTSPSAPNMAPFGDMEMFYYNLGYEPPPPYAFGAEETMPAHTVPTYIGQSWAPGSTDTSRCGSARPSEVNIGERVEKSRLGPSLIKGRIS